MPPLPSTIQEETANLVDSLTRRQKDLQEFQIPRLRDLKGSLATQQQYAAEMREDLELFAKSVQMLESLAEDQERERQRREVAHHAQLFTKSLDQMKKDARLALLTSKRAIDSMAQSNRDELLKSNAMSEKTSDEKSGDALINASNDVTEALRRTIGLMQGELERSVLSSQMLEQSSANLRSTTAAHDILSTLLSTSKHLITALEKSDWLDRLLILSAVAFFFLVVLFILKQRVIDKGIRIAFWWTRFIPNFSGDAELLKANIVGTGAGTVLATVTATTSSVASSLLATATTGIHSTPPGLDIEETLSAPAPSDSNLPASNAEEMDDAIQDIISSRAKPSPSPSISETSTILPNDKPRNHQEL